MTSDLGSPTSDLGPLASVAARQLPLDWSLDPLEARVLAIVREHRGREQAISARDLAAEAGIEESCRRRASPRAIQEIIHRLRVDHCQPIASASGSPSGYYIPETTEEIEDFCREQKARALGTLAAMAAVKRVALPDLLGQIRMEYESKSGWDGSPIWFLCNVGRRIARYGRSGSIRKDLGGRLPHERGSETDRHRDLLAHAERCTLCRFVMRKTVLREAPGSGATGQGRAIELPFDDRVSPSPPGPVLGPGPATSSEPIQAVGARQPGTGPAGGGG